MGNKNIFVMYYGLVFSNKNICGLVIITDFLFKVCLFRHFLRFLGRRYLGISLKNRPILHLCTFKPPIYISPSRHSRDAEYNKGGLSVTK